MIGFPAADMRDSYSFITRQTKDRESQEEFQFPAEYMFKDLPDKRIEAGVDQRRCGRWTCGASRRAWSACTARTGRGP